MIGSGETPLHDAVIREREWASIWRHMSAAWDNIILQPPVRIAGFTWVSFAISQAAGPCRCVQCRRARRVGISSTADAASPVGGGSLDGVGVEVSGWGSPCSGLSVRRRLAREQLRGGIRRRGRCWRPGGRGNRSGR